MANVGFVPIRGTQEQIDETSIVDGQLLFNTETSGKNKGRMYLDVDSQRLDVGGDLSTELTQAEYDLLSEEEKKIGTYYITDAKGTSVGALKKKIGDTDISDIGDGTCTGAISELNSNLNTILYNETFKYAIPTANTYQTILTFTIPSDGMFLINVPIVSGTSSANSRIGIEILRNNEAIGVSTTSVPSNVAVTPITNLTVLEKCNKNDILLFRISCNYATNTADRTAIIKILKL